MAKLFQEGVKGRALIDSAGGRIPDDWNITTLGSLCSPEGAIQTGPFGSQLHAHDYLPDGVPIINPTHIAEGRVIKTEIPRISHSDATRLSRHALRSGDILFSRRGDVGRHALISDREAGWLCGTGCLLVRPAERTVNSAYLSLFLDTPFAQNFLKAKAAGTIMPNINTKILASIPVARPPLAEQQRIAEVMGALDAARRSESDRLSALRALKAATMAKVFQDGVKGRARIDSAIGRIPADWKITTLDSLCSPGGTIQTGPFGSQLHAHDYLPGGVPIINPTHIAEGQVVEAEIPRISHADATRLSRHTLRPGDILFSRRGDVGRHALIGDREAGWLCGTGCLLVRPAESAVNPAYLSLFLDSSFAQSFLNTKAAGTIMPNINTKILASIPVALPPLAEQEQIVDHLDCVMRQITLSKERLDRHEALFGATLAALMTGTIRLTPALLELEALDAS